MEISTEFLTNYLLEKDFNWGDFDAISRMAGHKKEILIAQWRFGDTMNLEDVKKVFKAFDLSFDEFMSAYMKN